MLMAGDVVKVAKGCEARGVIKGTTLVVRSVESMGPEYRRAVKVVLAFGSRSGHKSGTTQAWWVRYAKRLSDQTIAMNDGNPFHKIVVLQKREIF